MEIKKTSKASLENKKSSWLLVGYVIVLVFMFVAFEWSKRDVRIDMSGAITENVFEEIPVEDEIFEVVEKNPEFSYNGMSLMQYLGKSIKYPTIAQETGTQGRVIVQFVVNKDGSIVDVKVVRGVDPYLDKEAIRVISTMPKWKPGEQRGKPVRCKFTVPVMFKLQ